MFISTSNNLSRVQNMLVGYSDDNFADVIKKVLGCDFEVVKKSDLHRFKVMPKRWIVERTFAWLEKNRRLWLRTQTLQLKTNDRPCFARSCFT